MLLHQIFEHQAARHPDRVAIEYSNTRTTYGELNASANKLAAYIKHIHKSRLGVVALSLERGPLTVTAVLAVLKAGFAWVPLPLDAPPSRIENILAISGSALVICSQATRHISGGICRTVVLDEPETRERIRQQSIVGLSSTDNGIGPADLCHILFTSGSTGVPKGVMLEHQAVAHNVQVLANRFALNEYTRTLQFAEYTFDVFGLDLFMTFYVGGCLIMGNLSDIMADLTSFINQARVNYAQLTPTIISLIEPKKVPILRVLASSGEPLTAQLLHEWADRVRLMNAYGPTETIVCTVQEMSGTHSIEPQFIGTALPGLDVVLMREDCPEEVPRGSVGEICVAGVQLFRGYIGVNEGPSRQVVHWGSQIFYRTGDLGYLSHSANSAPTIRLLGRRDGQVKVHGVRIDLGEVEEALRSHSGTRNCTALVPKAGPVFGRLAAVVSISNTGPWRLVKTGMPKMNVLHPTRPEQREALKTLIEWLRSRLPPQAVPSSWWIVDEFPLTSSGKVDRMSVQLWLENASEGDLTELANSWAIEDEKIPPSKGEDSTLQRQLTEMCSKVLGLSTATIDPRASLLQLGFDSLGIFRLISMARREGLDLSVQQVRREYSIRGLSLSLSQGGLKVKPLDNVDIEAFSLAPHSTSLQGLKAFVAEQCHVDGKDILDIYPCTSLQAGIMALAARRSDAYICVMEYVISPEVDISRFCSAWESLLAKTPVLRNRIVHDIRGVGLLQTTVKYIEKSYGDESLEEPMSFGDSLCRGRVVKDEATQTWKFILKIHHALFDGWTKDLIIHELIDTYERRTLRDQTNCSFTKYLKYLIEDVKNHEPEHISFWRHYLRNCTITDFPRMPNNWTGELSGEHDVLTRTITADVSEFARKHQVTTTTVVQAAWAIVLGRHSATNDVVFGLTLSGRDAPVDDITSIIGPTMVTVPYRVRWSNKITIGQLLRRLNDESSDLIPHQHYGLQNIANIGQDTKNACLFRSLLVVQPGSAATKGQEGFLKEKEQFSSDVLRTYPVTVEFILSDLPSAKVRIHHDKSTISKQTATLILHHLESSLAAISAADLYTPVNDIEIISKDERKQIMASQRDCPKKINRCLHELVQETARKHPNHIAVVQYLPRETLSYKQLDQFSTALAHYLKDNHKIGHGVIVHIGIEKSSMAIIAMLAVLKTGAAYVALDASHPAQHLQRITRHLKSKYALCSTRTYQKFHQIVEHALEIHDNWLLERPTTFAVYLSEQKHDATPNDTAVVFFTSGSTGEPKCIASRHSALATSIYHSARFLRLEPGARVFQSTSFAFDMSLKDIYCTLLSGACLCLPSDTDRLSAEQMCQMDISVAFLTPSVTEAISLEDVPSLRILNLGGEKATVNLIRRWANKVRLINSYGPTETVACLTFADNLDENADPTNIGKPVTGQVWIVQRNSTGSLVLAATGSVGEIAISGHTVAQGYMNDTTRTAKCFVQQPRWMQQAGADVDSYLYLTGDLGSKDEYGRITILGRNDSQVKINGVRIEPAEAEHALRQLGGIFTSAVVDAVPDSSSESPSQSKTILVAFIPAEDTDADEQKSGSTFPGSLIMHPDEVRKSFHHECGAAQRELALQVPRYLVPRFFIPVKFIPITVSGKTDRKRLQAALEDHVHRDRYMTAKSKVPQKPAPRSHNKQEARFCEIWQEVLGKKKIFGLSDHFFRIGGDSLTAIRLVMACKQQGLQITVAQIYEHPTLSQMATAAVEISDTRHASMSWLESPAPFSLLPSETRNEIVADAAEICNLDAQCIEDVYPASPFQEGLAAINLQAKEAYMARWVYALTGEIDIEKLEHALEVVVARNPIFRTTLAYTPKCTVQVVMKMSEWKRQQLKADSSGKDLQLEGNTSLFRYRLDADHGDEDKTYLEVDMHHILYDEWTVRYFLHDMVYNYGHPDAERPGRRSYANFIQQLRSMERNYEVSMAFWKHDLQGAQDLDFPRRVSPCYQFKTNSVIRSVDSISLEFEDDRLGERQAITPATVAAASLAIALSTYGRTEDVTFGLTLSGRHVAGLEEVSGPTISTVPLRTRTSDDRQTIYKFLSDVQSKMRKIQDLHPVGLQKIARLNVKGAKKACAFRTLLVVQQDERAGFSSESQTLQLDMVEEETFMSMNYGLVVVLVMDGSSRHAKFKIEFDSECVSQQEAHKVLGHLHLIACQLASMNGTVGNVFNEIGEHRKMGEMGHNVHLPNLTTSSSFHDSNKIKLGRLEQQQASLREVLRNLWAKALDLFPEHIGLDDTMNTLGGDSITLIKLLSAARKSGVSLSFGDKINQFTTLADMASVATTISQGDRSASAVDISLPQPFSLVEGFSKEACVRDAAAKCDVDPALVVDVYPCTPLQEGLMAASVMEPGSYIAQHSYKLLGNMNQGRLKSALERVWRLEAILRTRIFTTSSLETVQAVMDDTSLPFEIYRQYATLEEYLKKDQQNLFDYGKPLTRFALVIDDHHQTYLVISQHHAVSDGWTTRLLENAIKREYDRSEALNQNITTDNRMKSFINFVKDVQKSDDAAKFWKTTLTDATITNFPRPGKDKTFRATEQLVNSCIIPESAGTSLTSLLEAAWGLVLRKYSGCDDVCFGVVQSGRLSPIPDIDTMLGPTIATIPRRLKPQPKLLVSQYLDEVLSHANKSGPFEQYGIPNIRLLGQDARNACDFRTLLVVQPKNQLSEQAVVSSQLVFEPVDVGFMLDNYGLTVDCHPRENGSLSIYLSYDKSSISAAEADCISKSFIQAIFQLLEGSEKILKDIDIFRDQSLDSVMPSSHERETWSKPDVFSTNGVPNKASNGYQTDFSMRNEKINGNIKAVAQKAQPGSRFRDILRQLWADVLHVEAKMIDDDDDFLILGGDSISAIKLSSSARERGISLPARSILQEPSLKSMALHMTELQALKPQVRDSHSTGNGRQMYASQISATYEISQKDIEDVYHCTPLQTNLMALTMRQPGAYVATETFQLSPHVDIKPFMKAWELVYQRHELMRTRLCQVFDDDGHPALVQVVCASDAVPWHITTLDKLSYQHGKPLQQELHVEVNLGTHLAFLGLVKTLSGGAYFQLSRHHSIYDGWSTKLLWDDFKYAYFNGSSPSPRTPFRRYVQYLESFDRSEITDFWIKELDGFHAEHYPIRGQSHSPLPEREMSSVSLTYNFDTKIDHVINKFGFQQVARGAWSLALALVSRWPSQTYDICFGSVVSGRMGALDAIEDIAGPTMSTVPIRIKVDMAESVTQYLQRIRDSALAMTSYEHIGISNIKQISTGAKAACQFRNILVVQPPNNESAGSADELESICKAVGQDAMSQPYSLVVECLQLYDNRGLYLSASFEKAVLDEAEIRTVLEIFSRIITLLGDPGRGGTSLGSILHDLAKIEDYEKMLAFNGPALPKSPLCLHEIFERSVRTYPHRIAVLAHDQELTYEALDEVSSLLARYLQQKMGVGMSSLVPICFEKSSFMVITMLAIMKAGGAYVPLDPSHPSGRIKAMIEQCKSKFVLVSASQEARISSATALHHVVVGTSLLKQLRHENNTSLSAMPPPNVGPQNLAYMIFTSGSTGRPKGVLMEHGSVALSMMQYADIFDYATEKEFRVLQFSSYTFDVSVAEIFSTLASGGTVCIPTEENRLTDLVNVITSMKVNVAFITPTIASILRPSDVPNLETICMTGEAMTASLVQLWCDAPNIRLFNAYGPTEAAVHCSAGQIRPNTSHTCIGKSFGGQLWVVHPEDHTKLLPVGCVGEVVVSGSTLARGYLDNAEQTERAFINNVVWFDGIKPRRIYKTGDVVRYRGDGTIEFMGRKDGSQVKFHGQRIELGEIEAAIYSCDRDGALLNVAVEKLPFSGRDSLVAFFQINTSSTPMRATQDFLISCHDIPYHVTAFVRATLASLRDLLPQHMIPSLFLPVSRWSHGVSGKTDRQFLRKLAANLSDTEEEMYRAMGLVDDSHIEFANDGNKDVHDVKRHSLATSEPQQVSQIKPGINGNHTSYCSPSHAIDLVTSFWKKVLGRAANFQPALDQDFFSLGGDSVSVIFLVAEFRRVEINVTVNDIYQHKTIASMVELILSRQEPGQDKPLSSPRVGTNHTNQPFSLLQATDVELKCLLNELASELNVSPESITDVYPCTSLQEGIIFLSERVEGSYHAHLSISMPHQLDLERLYSAFRNLVQMHDILRTRIVFHRTLGSLQVVLTTETHFSETGKLNLMSEDESIRFGYGLPLHRHCLAARNDRIYLEFDCHHSVYDGWSLPLLMEDLQRLYYQDTSRLPEPAPVPFKDVVAYVHSPSVVEAAENFWDKYLQAAVMSDFPELAGHTHDSIRATAYYEHQISLETVQIPKDKTIATVLTAAWALVVSRNTASNDVCFGALLSGRNAPIPGIEAIRGPTINTVPFRVVLDYEAATVADMLDRVQSHMLDIIPYQFTSLSKLSKAFSAGHGQFGSLLSIQTGGRAARDVDTDTCESEFSISSKQGGDKETPNFFGEPYPLFLEVDVDQSSGNIVFGAQFDTGIISAGHISRILDQYGQVIRQLANVDFQNVRLGDIELLSDADMQCLLDWAGEPVQRGDMCVHEIIKRIAIEHPHHQAIEGFSESLTYGQLDQQSNALANHIWKISDGKLHSGSTIPVWMETSPKAVVAILAVLKLGASYVPLDHRFPVARAEFITEDISARIMLVSKEKSSIAAKLVDRLQSQTKTAPTVVQVDAALETIENLERPIIHSIPPCPTPTTSDLAYMIYTSGSTGKPKGVMMEHWALTATVKEQAITYGFDSNTRMFGLASLSWDPSLLEIFAILTHGGCLCIPTEDERSGCMELVDSINRHRANQISTSPAVASLIDLRLTPTVKAISLGGEVIREENIVNAHQAGVQLFNIYGPSEACIDAIVHRNVIPGVSPQNIGYPMSSQVWIVDPADPKKLVPPGCAGELALSGTLARGYLNDEVMTARSFLADCPFASPLYLTGDLGRYESDGSIYFLGRKDRQVKLNGQRVELGDIENAVRTLCPQNDVAVDYFSAFDNDKKLLVVYLTRASHVSSSSPPPSPGKNGRDSRPVQVKSRMQPHSEEFQRLQRQLRSLLPRYMVPRVFMTVSRLPLSFADKVDFKLLRTAYAKWMEETLPATHSGSNNQTKLAHSELDSSASSLSLVSSSEAMLRSIWASAIGCAQEAIQSEDDIFDLGADSLTVIKVAMLARKEGYNLTVAQIYASPVLSQMVKSLNSDSHRIISPVDARKADPPPFSLLPTAVYGAVGNHTKKVNAFDDVVDMFPCSFFQTMAITQGQKRHKAYYAWFLIRMKGTSDLERLEVACNLLVQQHAALRTSFHFINGEFVQQIHAPARQVLDFQNVGLCSSEEAFVALLDHNDPSPVSLGRILTRFRIAPYNGDNGDGYILGIGMSHAQYDGFCWTRIIDDIYHAYLTQTLQDKQPPSYSRFISQSLKTSLGSDSKSFWKELLHGAKMTSLSPRTEEKRPFLALNKKQTRTLPRYNTRLGNATFAIVVKVAWSIVLSWLTGNTDVVFGSLVFGRNPQIDGIGDIVGACINVVPNRVSLSGKSSMAITDLLEIVRRQQISIVPFETTSLPEVSRYVHWPAGTRFGSIVQHQNIDEDVFTANTENDDYTSKIGTSWSFAGSAAYPGLCDDVLDCWIFTVPRPTETKINFQYNNSSIPDSCASRITQVLCDVIHSIYTDPFRPVASIDQPRGVVSSIRMQLHQQLEFSYETVSANGAQKDQDKGQNKLYRDPDRVISILRNLWDQVLPEPSSAEREIDDNTSFFALGGNTKLAERLATSCQNQGLMLTAQAIFAFPTMGMLAAYLCGHCTFIDESIDDARLILEPN